MVFYFLPSPSIQTSVLKFRHWLDVAPIPVELDEDSEGPYMKIMACSYTHDKATPSFFCVLDCNGEVVDFKRFNNLAKRKFTTYTKEREEKEEDLKMIKEFVDKHRPDAVVVSTETRDSLSLVEEIKECLGELEAELAEEAFLPIPVELVDPNVACIFSKSRRGKVSHAQAFRVVVTQNLTSEYCQCAHLIHACMRTKIDAILGAWFIQVNPLSGSLNGYVMQCL